MATNKLQWKRIAKGDRLPCDSLLMKKDGTIPSVVSGAGVKVGQDAYYLPVDDVIEEIRNYPIEESEDEKTRKELFERFSHIKGFDWYGLPIKDILAWLEKQGEHANFRNKIQIGDKVTRNEDGVLVNLSQLNRVAKKDEKQGEQKPVKKEDWCFEKGKWYVKLCHDYEGDLRHFQEGHVYQAVSETSITDGYHHVSLNSWQIPKYFRPATKEEIPQELKPVEPQQDMLSQEQYVKAVDECVYGEQKPAEWNEEDEKILSNIIKDLVHPWNEYIPDRIEDEIKWLKNKLKSLRPQSTWKPSDEQMELIKDIVFKDRQKITRKELAIFHSIYNDLKKLKA